MSIKQSHRELLWVGITLAAILAMFTMSFRTPSQEAASINFRSDSIDLINAMRLALVTASEAQNSSALSNSEQDSREFSKTASDANAKVEQLTAQIKELLAKHGTQADQQLLDQFTESFAEFRGIDKQLRELSAENSNYQAFELAVDPAAKLVDRFDKTLQGIAADEANKANVELMRDIAEARIGIYRIQAMLTPHIIELDNSKMDAIEADIRKIDDEIALRLSRLNTQVSPVFAPTLADAKAAYEEYVTIRHRITELSRKNTDLRSAQIAITEKRQAMIECQDALSKLESAIAKEPIDSMVPSSRVGSL